VAPFGSPAAVTNREFAAFVAAGGMRGASGGRRRAGRAARRAGGGAQYWRQQDGDGPNAVRALQPLARTRRSFT
jgi:formylglycine-generating enzyme required for sulfatase activity